MVNEKSNSSVSCDLSHIVRNQPAHTTDCDSSDHEDDAAAQPLHSREKQINLSLACPNVGCAKLAAKTDVCDSNDHYDDRDDAAAPSVGSSSCRCNLRWVTAEAVGDTGFGEPGGEVGGRPSYQRSRIGTDRSDFSEMRRQLEQSLRQSSRFGLHSKQSFRSDHVDDSRRRYERIDSTTPFASAVTPHRRGTADAVDRRRPTTVNSLSDGGTSDSNSDDSDSARGTCADSGSGGGVDSNCPSPPASLGGSGSGSSGEFGNDSGLSSPKPPRRACCEMSASQSLPDSDKTSGLQHPLREQSLQQAQQQHNRPDSPSVGQEDLDELMLERFAQECKISLTTTPVLIRPTIVEVELPLKERVRDDEAIEARNASLFVKKAESQQNSHTQTTKLKPNHSQQGAPKKLDTETARIYNKEHESAVREWLARRGVHLEDFEQSPAPRRKAAALAAPQCSVIDTTSSLQRRNCDVQAFNQVDTFQPCLARNKSKPPADTMAAAALEKEGATVTGQASDQLPSSPSANHQNVTEQSGDDAPDCRPVVVDERLTKQNQNSRSASDAPDASEPRDAAVLSPKPLVVTLTASSVVATADANALPKADASTLTNQVVVQRPARTKSKKTHTLSCAAGTSGNAASSNVGSSSVCASSEHAVVSPISESEGRLEILDYLPVVVATRAITTGCRDSEQRDVAEKAFNDAAAEAASADTAAALAAKAEDSGAATGGSGSADKSLTLPQAGSSGSPVQPAAATDRHDCSPAAVALPTSSMEPLASPESSECSAACRRSDAKRRTDLTEENVTSGGCDSRRRSSVIEEELVDVMPSVRRLASKFHVADGDLPDMKNKYHSLTGRSLPKEFRQKRAHAQPSLPRTARFGSVTAAAAAAASHSIAASNGIGESRSTRRSSYALVNIVETADEGNAGEASSSTSSTSNSSSDRLSASADAQTIPTTSPTVTATAATAAAAAAAAAATGDALRFTENCGSVRKKKRKPRARVIGLGGNGVGRKAFFDREIIARLSKFQQYI